MITKKLFTTIAFAFVLLFSGCAKDDFNEIDGVCPLVVSTVPEDGDIDVPLNQVITATFNEKMNPSTITKASFTVGDNVALIDGTVTYTDSTAVFTPSSLLDEDTEYTGTITTLAKDKRGNALQEDYVWTFTTVPPLPQFTVIVSSNPTLGGVTTGGGLFDQGATVTVTAVPNAGYTFDNWTDNGIEVSTSANYQFLLTADRTLVANYSLIPASQFAVNLSSLPVEGGSTNGSGSFDAGTNVTVTATPNAGFTFDNWTENELEVSTAANYQFVIAADRTLVANYVPEQFTIALSVSPLLSGTTVGAGIFDAGTTRTVTAMPENGFVFENWTEGGVIVTGATATYQFVLAGNRTLVANFVVEPIAQFSVILSSNPIDGGTTDGAGLFDAGSTVQVTAFQNNGYIFDNWTDINNAIVSSDAIYEFPLTQDRTLVANFSLIATAACTPLVNLLSAGDYAILAETGISSVIGTTTTHASITGDMGIYDYAASSITNFNLIMDSGGTFSTSEFVTGRIYAADYPDPTHTDLGVAVGDMYNAFTNGNGLPNTEAIDLKSGDLDGDTLYAGVYEWGSDLNITNGITLDGGNDDCAMFVFKISGKLIVNPGAIITLANGAHAKNIYWLVAGSGANLDTTVQFEGNILSQTLISLNTGASVNGRLLAQSAVTLELNTVVVKPQ